MYSFPKKLKAYACIDINTYIYSYAYLDTFTIEKIVFGNKTED